MYIRRKTQKRKSGWTADYYYAVESYRQNGKVKQRTIVYIGDTPDVDAAIVREQERLERLQASRRLEAKKYIPQSTRRLRLLREVKAAL